MATIVPSKADIGSVTVFKFSGNQPNHPPISYVFPKRSFGSKSRSCQHAWFSPWSWLHYNEEKDTVLCGICARAVSEGKLKQDVTAKGDPSFVTFYSYFIESVHYHHFRPQEAFATGRMPLTLFENMRPAYSTKRLWRGR